MAYFEYGYVNTDYDVDSAAPPVTGVQESICNFPYSTKDVVSSKIVNFNYDVTTTILSKIVDFNYNTYDAYAEKTIDFNLDIFALFYENYVELAHDVELAILEHSKVDLNYDIGDKTSAPILFVTRLNEDD